MRKGIQWLLLGLVFIALLIVKLQDRDDDDVSLPPALETSIDQ